MYLKCIRCNGFKSFAEKTEFDINRGITGVVGPNGSGKSNIVDAVRWVLGEQSVKALRGDNSMSDVIFAGSKSRGPQSRAWVSLTFDNTDHYLNSEFNEVEIKRCVYRTGENEYYINNTKVRLKDITDLFLDSGAGKESFNIISQGAVADIINSKPEDRRVIFEEAAGVLKYKKRKEESYRKLEKTNENLERVNLLIDEGIIGDIIVDGKNISTYLCMSENFRKPGEDKTPLDTFYEMERKSSESPLDFCDRMGWSGYIRQMLVVDFLILNRDRHGANIEVLRDKKRRTVRLAPLFDHGLSLLSLCRNEAAIEEYDVMEDKPVQCFVGSHSALENLSLIPVREFPALSPLKESDKTVILEGLNDIISSTLAEKIWEMIWKRWCFYEDLCNKK